MVLIISKDYFFGGGGAGAGAAEAKRYYIGQVANTSCEIWVLFACLGVCFILKLII